ncbi:hypothetical protein AA106556_0057 [Neokomagataea tanensis NBRC 106556]|uniref:Uncharacterized protein n=1 Tax=Neokomagataea tanensis NBRC 106556 TaxID=1223519 RepID=A0ABQ0QFZ9_9PROT|nr:hypothetical protein AA106556_0057 [Neokomagataea tanensis NBRC 106556]
MESLEAEISAPDKHSPLRHVHIPLNRHPTSAHGIAHPDLSDDPLAGTDVTGTLHARSVSGQYGQSKTVHFRLGARHFTDPLARAIIALRARLLLAQETPQDATQELLLLTEATKDRPLLSTLTLLASRLPTEPASEPTRLIPVTDALWDFALYLEDRKTTDPATADASAAVRAAEKAVRQHIEDMAGQDSSTHLTEQQKLHDLTETLKQALAHRMALLFQRAAQSGIVMPSAGASDHDPFSTPMEKLRSQAMQGQTESALQTLQDMEDMAEHMRQAGPQDMQALAHTMQAQEEARMERSALRDLIRRETELLDHAQLRLSAARKAAQPMDDEAQPDVSQMSTNDLLKQLGMQPPVNNGPTNAPTQPPPQAPLDDTTVREQAPQRRDDHALQRALTQLDIVLGQRTQANTGKKVEAFDTAKTDMIAARHALAERHDPEAAAAEQKVLDDLNQANQTMQKNQKSSSGQGQGSLSFIPPARQTPSPHHGTSQSQKGDQNPPSDDDSDDDDDSDNNATSNGSKGGSSADKNQDPLGRDMGEGHNGQDSDAHIPDQNTRDRAREIERELRRRAADRTRPQSELDYLQRLLKSF